MIKLCLIVALALAGVQAQNTENGESAAAEPYSYGYQTETHSASEQRDPSGTVTGYYTLADADGRQRRVEYVADAAGFRAKVATNEVGTKSENSADVEVQAYPPTEGQLVVQAAPAPQQQPQRVYSQQVTAVPQRAGVAYLGQAGYGSYGYGYTGYPYTVGGYRGFTGYNNGYGLAGYNNGYGVAGYPAGYGSYNGAIYGGYGAATGANGAYYTSYNNHLPSQYYRSIGQPIGYGVQGASRYVSSSSLPVSTVSGVSGASSGSAVRGSSNYIVLQKRDSQTAQKETTAKSS